MDWTFIQHLCQLYCQDCIMQLFGNAETLNQSKYNVLVAKLGSGSSLGVHLTWNGDVRGFKPATSWWRMAAAAFELQPPPQGEGDTWLTEYIKMWKPNYSSTWYYCRKDLVQVIRSSSSVPLVSQQGAVVWQLNGHLDRLLFTRVSLLTQEEWQGDWVKWDRR